MNGFLIKKAFFDGWDNLLGMVLQNLLYMGMLLLVLLAMGLQEGAEPFIIPALALIALVFSFVTSGVGACTYAYSRYERVGWSGFKRGIARSVRHTLLYWVVIIALLLVYTFVMPFYAAYRNLFGLLVCAVLFWVSLAFLLAMMFYWPLHYTMEGDRPTKTLRKCFIIMFDNMGRTLFCAVFTLVQFCISVMVAGLIPGVSGISLMHMDFIKLIMLKYDYLDEHPDADRKHLPWYDLTYEDRESVGPRSLKNMIFPWKD